MTRRQRNSPGSAELASRPPGGVPAPARLGTGAGAKEPATPPWEEFFPLLSAAQQQHLLALVDRQGLLYAHQLPPPANGTAPEPNRPFLLQLLSGQAGQLEPLRPPPLADLGPDWDEAQREAVARALHTPDVCLIQGYPGSGKSRLIAEIITRAAGRGERILFVAPATAALDQVLERLTARDTVFPIRCLDKDETLDSLPPAIRALTFAERVQALKAHALASARRERESCAQRLTRLRQDGTAWPALAEVAKRRQQLEQLTADSHAHRGQIATEVKQEAEEATPAAAWREALVVLAQARRELAERLEREMADLRARQVQLQEQLESLAPGSAALKALVDAKQQGHWWTKSWWQATIRSNLLGQWEELERRRQELRADLDVIAGKILSVQQERDQGETRYQSERAAVLRDETGRRLRELDEQDAAARQEEAGLLQKWQALCESLDAASPLPEAMTLAAVEGKRAAWQQELKSEEERLEFAPQWIAYLEGIGNSISSRLPGYVNVVAATLTGLPADEHFGERASTGMTGPLLFDLLILDEADQVTETELLKASRRARRWVLVGEPGLDMTGGSNGTRKISTGLNAAATAGARSAVFQRLWQRLHSDPRGLPYAWTQEPERLSCRLRAVPAELSQWVERERLADYPDIELRILSVPRTPPALAEIIFPPSVSIEQAKQFVFRELEELPVRASGKRLCWVEEPERLVLRLAERQCRHDLGVLLETGVLERVSRVHAVPGSNGERSRTESWQTCCLEFDRTTGWGRDRAEGWVRRHLGLCDLGRTAWLDVLHRMTPGLAAFVSDCLGFIPALAFPHTGGGVPNTAPSGPPVEFVPVPMPQLDKPRGKSNADRSIVDGQVFARLKGGAGLELDLADSRQRERLPGELRSDLPGKGLVNYIEAQAIIRTLATLAAQAQAEKCKPIAVIALYPGQAELLRRMLRQLPAMADAGLAVEVGVPSAFRQREFAHVFVSLTRSHTHRAVSYGEAPRLLPLALTRARERLLLFGDPGTLVRRAQWDGPLEQLDEAAAAFERTIIVQLARYLQEQSPQLDVFRVRQGNGP